MPYSSLPPHAFWKLCREAGDFRIGEIYAPKIRIAEGEVIATAGSCFAQNISRYLGRSNLTLGQEEPAPKGMSETVARRYGYGLYSARYGNVYTARQLRQLLEDAGEGRQHEGAVWEREGRYFDALRPGVEPDGLASADEVIAHRAEHLAAVERLVARMDVLVFTLGLTETWEDVQTGLVFPTAPGVIAGTFDPARHRFLNQTHAEVMADMEAALALLRTRRPGLRVILTVSPVPLTATASGSHVLAATTLSKSILRGVAGEMAQRYDWVDYFPSYEMIAGLPFGAAQYEDNLRSVSEQAVDGVMQVFFAAQGARLDVAPVAAPQATKVPRRVRRRQAEVCEEALLEAFARK